ncbi:hypothetical protein EII34_09460 [Arachnia propionica]|uniref:Uncharacterized protein n=1 Tax=Arachnia propionica TaxID=1750 RepID=A0A3P1T5Q1_9ACTN|nr:hypothetical protein [Arachnia propionica]RRD04525.1 hypothetical protein EII34_09460 [Arachnia propionica]
MTTLEQRIVEADHHGDLDQAIHLAARQLLLHDPVEQRITRFIRLSRTLRHRGLGDDLQRAQAAAHEAVRLSRLPTAPDHLLPHAHLAQAGVLLALGDEAGCQEITLPLVRPGRDTEPGVAARAWRLLGETALGRRAMAEAIACLLNSVAEEPGFPRQSDEVTPILLLEAFSRAGQILDADRVAEETVTLDLSPRRRAIFLLTRAGHERRFGHIDRALDTLGDAETLLRRGSGLNRLLAHLHRLRAACLDDWQLTAEAEQQRLLAQELTTWSRPAPTRSAVVPLPRHPARITPTPLTRRLPDSRAVAELINDVQRLPRLESRHALALEQATQLLHGIPGEERSEALALVKAGTLLARGPEHLHPTAARLLRRALARLTYLEGTQLWQARCRCELGLLLTPSRPEQALELLVAAVAGLSEQRHRMRRRAHRCTWRESVEDPPFAATIELAHRLGRDDLAADLIIASRLAGVVTPDGRGDPSPGDRVQEVPLQQVPTLIHIDGTPSRFGGSAVCRLL